MNLSIKTEKPEIAEAIKSMVEDNFKNVTCEIEANEEIEKDGVTIHD